jgi:hypothetical protein
VNDADFTRALDELLDETSALTRVLLGHSQPGDAMTPHDWMERIARVEGAKDHS